MNRATSIFLSVTFAVCFALSTGCGPSGKSMTPGSGTAKIERGEALDDPISFPTAVAVADAALNWPHFRGPNHMGAVESQGVPIEWSEEKNVQWKVDLQGGGASTPIVYGDRIFLTTYSGYLVPKQPTGSLDALKRHVHCLSINNGEVLWTATVPAKLPEEARIRDHGYAANSVAVDEKRVYAFLGKSGVIALDHQGEQLWTADVGANTSGWGTAASPVLYEDLVFINASVESGSLIALDAATGEQRWKATGIREAWNTPLVIQAPSGKDELVVGVHGKILGMDTKTGEQLWTCDTDITWYMVPSPVAKDGVVYFLGGRSGTAALAVKTGGEGDVTATHRLWTSKHGSNVTSPVLHEGHLYWMHEKLGVAYCANAATGELLYEKRLERAGQVYASAILVDGRIYYVSRSGRTFVVAADPEFKLLATNILNDGTQFDASPAITGNRLLIRSGKHLYCLQQP